MNEFSISQLSYFSGIKPHTIRIWEQRYEALRPKRSSGNTRYYDNSQLRRLLNIVSLIDAGYKVAEVCSMPDKNMFKLLADLEDKESDKDAGYYVSQLIAAGIEYDERHFDKIFSHCMLRYGMKDAYVKVIYKLLNRIGLMWATDRLPPAQEHFISNLLRQKLFTAIDSLPPPRSQSGAWLLFLPENEFHEIGLLFACYLIRAAGRKVIYLGTNVPLPSVVIAAKEISPENLLLFCVHAYPEAEILRYVNELSRSFKGKNIFVSGNYFQDFPKNEKKIGWLQTVEDLEQKLLIP